MLAVRRLAVKVYAGRNKKPGIRPTVPERRCSPASNCFSATTAKTGRLLIFEPPPGRARLTMGPNSMWSTTMQQRAAPDVILPFARLNECG